MVIIPLARYRRAHMTQVHLHELQERILLLQVFFESIVVLWIGQVIRGAANKHDFLDVFESLPGVVGRLILPSVVLAVYIGFAVVKHLEFPTAHDLQKM